MRVCPKPGCPTLIPKGARYCPAHQREYEADRGTAEQRGYDAEHERMRAYYARAMAQGRIYRCPRCHLPIDPTAPWDLGHTDDRTAWTGPEHATCNRAEGGRRGAAMRYAG